MATAAVWCSVGLDVPGAGGVRLRPNRGVIRERCVSSLAAAAVVLVPACGDDVSLAGRSLGSQSRPSR
jgi:hypothetical protein